MCDTISNQDIYDLAFKFRFMFDGNLTNWSLSKLFRFWMIIIEELEFRGFD